MSIDTLSLGRPRQSEDHRPISLSYFWPVKASPYVHQFHHVAITDKDDPHVRAVTGKLGNRLAMLSRSF